MENQTDLAARLSQLEAENARLRAAVAQGKADSSAPHSGRESAAAANAPPPTRSYGSMKLWVGSWNMGAVDPFLSMDIRSNADTCSRMLAPFVPVGYDVYVLGIQEGISDKVFEAIEAHTGAFRLPLNAKLYPAREMNNQGQTRLRSRRMGRAITAQAFIDDAKAGYKPEPVASTTDMMDRVWGRGDGAMLTPKYTGIAVFVSPVVAPYVRLLGMYKHSFGASEGSKGGVGVALGVYDVTLAFVNAHMASKRADIRRAQYCELVDRLGAKLGGRGFGLVQSFHHVLWLGDLNTHCKAIGAKDALNLVRTGRHMQLLLQHDELLSEKEEGLSWSEFEEPLMAPDFWPTYKKLPSRGPVDPRASDWVSRVYVTAYKEPFYKGGRVAERVPSWTDRIQYHSLPDRWGELLPEPLQDPVTGTTVGGGLHNYRSVNDGLDCSDHSPVFATFTLEIVADDEEDEQGTDAPDSTGHMLVPGGIMPDADYGSLHPALRPLVVVLQLNNIVVDYGGLSLVPRAVSILFPLPYEDSNDIPERTKVVRPTGLLSFARTPGADYIGAATRVVVSQARKLETMHLLLKVSLDDNTKAQAVLAMRDGGFVGSGSHMNNFLLPLSRAGVPCMAGGRQASVSFVMEMTAYERGGVQTVSEPTAGVPGQTGPVTYPPHQPGGPSALRRGDQAGAEQGDSQQQQQAHGSAPHTAEGSRRASVEGPSAQQLTAAAAADRAAAAVAAFRSPKAPTLPLAGRPGVAVGASPARPGAGQASLGASAALARPTLPIAETPGQGSARAGQMGVSATPAGGMGSATPGSNLYGGAAPTPGVNTDLARARAAQMMAAARFKAATAAQASAAGRSASGVAALGSAGSAGATSAGTIAAAAAVLKAKQYPTYGSATSTSEGSGGNTAGNGPSNQVLHLDE